MEGAGAETRYQRRAYLETARGPTALEVRRVFAWAVWALAAFVVLGWWGGNVWVTYRGHVAAYAEADLQLRTIPQCGTPLETAHVRVACDGAREVVAMTPGWRTALSLGKLLLMTCDGMRCRAWGVDVTGSWWIPISLGAAWFVAATLWSAASLVYGRLYAAVRRKQTLPYGKDMRA